jgi:hypothetical protein
MLTFEIAAKQTFPELTSTITRKQAQEAKPYYQHVK